MMSVAEDKIISEAAIYGTDMCPCNVYSYKQVYSIYTF